MKTRTCINCCTRDWCIYNQYNNGLPMGGYCWQCFSYIFMLTSAEVPSPLPSGAPAPTADV